MVCVIVFSKLVSWSFLLQIFKLMLESMTIIFNVVCGPVSAACCCQPPAKRRD